MMSDNLDPISPSQAAQILSNSRWNRDLNEAPQMPPETASGEELYGKEGVEASQGYEPMRSANPVKQAADEALDSAEVRQQLQEPQEIPAPLPINYLEQAGSKAGQPIDERFTVSAEQASSDLSRWRENVGQTIEAAQDEEIRRAIDELRSGDAQPQPEAQQAELHPNDVTASPEAQARTPEPAAVVDDEVQKALSSPKVLAAVQQHIAQAEAQSNAVSQYYAQAVQHNAMAATAALLSQFPELQNLTPEQVPVAIQTVARSNPERAQSMVRHIENTRALVAEQQKVQAAQAQAYQQAARQQFDVAAENADANFDDYAKTHLSPAQSSEIREEAVAMLKDYGLTEKEIAWHWQNNSLFRSFPAQRLMADAARWRLSQKAISSKAVRPKVPQVMRPGSPVERGSEAEYEFRSLSDKINRTQGREQIKAAADLIAARRARR